MLSGRVDRCPICNAGLRFVDLGENRKIKECEEKGAKHFFQIEQESSRQVLYSKKQPP